MIIFISLLNISFILWLFFPIKMSTVHLYYTLHDCQPIPGNGYSVKVIPHFPEDVYKGTPFELSDNINQEMDFTCKQVFEKGFVKYYVRTDIHFQFLNWVFWWLIFRVEESRLLTEKAIIVLLSIWGIINIKDIPRGQNLVLKDLILK